MLREGLQRVGAVVARLLEATSSTAPKIFEVDVSRLVADVCARLDTRARAKGVSLAVQASSGSWPLSPDHFSEAVGNVVENAIDASPAGGTVRLRADLRRGADAALSVVVEDSGQGIPPEHLARVFEPFFSTKAVSSGAGLGLAIVRRVMDEHGGKVEITSEVGKGTKVHLTFPA
jgi:signal transduction histidine kinase